MKVVSRALPLVLTLSAVAAASSVWAAPAPANRFQAHHEAVLRDIPAGAKKARIWLVVPRDDPAQKNWVKDPQHLKASPNGESDYCLTTKTGNCTDFHSLYASLARSIGIPTRMVYGSFFQGENNPLPNKPSLDGKDTDASYHCWIEFYAKGPGWIPLDVALADLLPSQSQQEWYFGYLDARRLTWSYGRDLTLAPKQDAGPVNAMTKVYVEIDGKPHTGWDRRFTYLSVK